jgi:hypothetical protein
MIVVDLGVVGIILTRCKELGLSMQGLGIAVIGGPNALFIAGNSNSKIDIQESRWQQ